MHTGLLEGSVGSVSLDAASRMGLISVTFTTEATWPGPSVRLSELGRSLTRCHTESSEMGSRRGPQLFQSIAAGG